MKKKCTLRVGTRTFTSRKEATEYTRSIRDKWAPGKPITGDDHAFLLALLTRHDEAASKVGSGVDHFEVRLGPRSHPAAPSWCFWVVRTDGSVEDFSFTHCLKRSVGA